MVPLKGGAVVKLAWRDDDPPPKFPYMFWDGKAWHGADTFGDLVHANVKAMAAMAGRTFINYGTYSDEFRLASDGKGGLWYACSSYERIPGGGGRVTQKPVGRFEYFDGANWHDVRAEAGLDPNDLSILRCVGGGSAVLVEGIRSESLRLVTIKDGALRPTHWRSAPAGAAGRGATSSTAPTASGGPARAAPSSPTRPGWCATRTVSFKTRKETAARSCSTAPAGFGRPTRRPVCFWSRLTAAGPGRPLRDYPLLHE